MRRFWVILGIALACGAAFFALLMRSAQLTTVASSDMTAESLLPSPAEQAEPLFASLDVEELVALSITTAECSYEFRCASEKISLNGQKADHDVFATLLDQILLLPVIPTDPFPMDGTLMATLVLTIGDQTHTVTFYRSSEEAYAGVVSGPPNAPCYHKTDAWRVGTMLLTCEGTRIQDASGQETPAQ